MSTRTALLVPLTWTGLPATTVTQTDMTNVMAIATNAMSVSSYGAFTLSVTVAPWQTVTEPSNHDLSPALFAAANGAATAAGYTPSSYDLILITHNDPNITVAITSYQGRYVLYPTSAFALAQRTASGPPAVLHEIYHTLGVDHSHTVFVTDGASSPTQTWSPNASVVVQGQTLPLTGSQMPYPTGPLASSTHGVDHYGDPFSVLGSSFGFAIDPYQKIELGWMPPARMATLTKGQTVTLSDLDATSGTAVAFIHPSATRSYMLDYPAPVGLQHSQAMGFFTFGVRVKVIDRTYRFPNNSESYSYPYLLDAEPAAAGQDAGGAPFWNAPIAANTSWTTPEGWKISVGTVSSTSGAVVSIS